MRHTIFALLTVTLSGAAFAEQPPLQAFFADLHSHTNGSVVETGQSQEWTATRTPAAGKHYWFAKITQADGDLLWSAPAWLTVAAE